MQWIKLIDFQMLNQTWLSQINLASIGSSRPLKEPITAVGSFFRSLSTSSWGWGWGGYLWDHEICRLFSEVCRPTTQGYFSEQLISDNPTSFFPHSLGVHGALIIMIAQSWKYLGDHLMQPSSQFMNPRCHNSVKRPSLLGLKALGAENLVHPCFLKYKVAKKMKQIKKSWYYCWGFSFPQ